MFLSNELKYKETGILIVKFKISTESYLSATAKKKINLKSRKQLSQVTSAHASADDVINSLSQDKPEINTENVIMIETVYDVNDNLVQLKFLKNNLIPRKVIKIIALTIPYQPHLTSITINSGLSMDTLYEISKILPNSNIIEISLDNTFVSEANYHTLLTHSKLKHLSLAKCTINDDVVKTIVDQLKDPRSASQKLSALNLSSNRITDIGAKYVADMLRTNRQLCYLNLAGNRITDQGAMNILDQLHEFPLHDQEILESRTRYVTYLKLKRDLMNAFIMELQTVKFDKNPKKRIMRKGKLDAQSLQNLISQKRIQETPAELQIILEKAEFMAEKKLGLFNEPFSPNNTFSKDGVVRCFGNNTLAYLNIAYNNLSYVSLKKLQEVLTSQKAVSITPRGLVKVVIEGNLLPVACKEYEEIDRLLGVEVRKHLELANKRKPLSSRSTANIVK